MKYLKYMIILFLISNVNLSFADEQEIKLQNKITKNLRCLICQGQSIYDSDSQFAISLKILVKKKLSEGLSEKEIYEYFENKYGEWILYDPKFNKNTYLLWFLPLLILLLGGAIIVNKLIKIKK